jgi:hypothetical protein
MIPTRRILSSALAALALCPAAAFAQCPNSLYDRAAWMADLPVNPLHDVDGEVTVINETTLHAEHFSYNGLTPSVYFYLGDHNMNGVFVPMLRVGPELGVYDDEALTLVLPDGETLDDYSALSVWCEDFSVNFSSADFAAPTMMNARAGWAATLEPGDHDAQGKATIINDHLIFVENFTYDGTAPAVYFYLGETDTQADFVNGLETKPLLDRAYDDESLVVTLPDGASVDDYGAISVWCAAFDVNFTSASFEPNVIGDTDGDGDVDQADLGDLLAAFGSMQGDANYNADADFDEDGDVDQADLGSLLSNYGCAG